MKRTSLIIFFTLLIEFVLTGQESDYKIVWNYEGQSFNEFVTSTESHYNVRFFYKTEWVNNIRLRKYDNVQRCRVYLTASFRAGIYIILLTDWEISFSPGIIR